MVTPIAAMFAAAVGATIGAMVASRFSPTAGLILVVIAGVIGAGLGVWLWLRMIRRSPNLQASLAVTPEGAPRPDVVDELIGTDETPVAERVP